MIRFVRRNRDRLAILALALGMFGSWLSKVIS